MDQHRHGTRSRAPAAGRVRASAVQACSTYPVHGRARAGAEPACAHLASLLDLWEADPSALFAPDDGLGALATALEPCGHDGDPIALAAFTRWALADAGRARARGVRGGSAYITIEEPRLRGTGLARAYLLREADSQVLVRCDWEDGRRAALRFAAGWHGLAVVGSYRWVAAGGLPRRSIPRHGRAARAGRVHGERAPDTRYSARGSGHRAPARAGCGRWDTCRRGVGGTEDADRAGARAVRRCHTLCLVPPATPAGIRTGFDALAGAEAMGVTVPAGYALWAATSGRVLPTRAVRRPNCGRPQRSPHYEPSCRQPHAPTLVAPRAADGKSHRDRAANSATNADKGQRHSGGCLLCFG